MENIIISDPEKFESKIKAIIKDGVDNIHILTDFDKTLTRAYVDGKEIPSLISVLRDHNYLTPDYPEKAHAFYNKYHAIEVDPDILRDEKIKAMQEWWEKHFALLINSRLNLKDIKNIIDSSRVKLRDGAPDFLDFLKKYDIPLVIISASGLGTEAISMYFKNENRLYDNIHIVSNEFEWDKDGYMVRAKDPIIHSMNKSEVILRRFLFFDQIKNRKNIILLGDTLDDLQMAEGFDYKNLLSVGFLNKNIEARINDYKNIFDVVLTGDSSMDFINNLLKEIINRDN